MVLEVVVASKTKIPMSVILESMRKRSRCGKVSGVSKKRVLHNGYCQGSLTDSASTSLPLKKYRSKKGGKIVN